jgi:deazaflavin-dependent oxidoreductase (nitroreductase family)
MAPADRSPPGRLTRAFLRAPTLLYRVRLGWLLGNRFLCIVHRGRRTGKLRRTVVEVVHFDRETPEALVVAGWGPRTQWYRNLEAEPALEVMLGHRRWREPRQRFLDEGERVRALEVYAEEHPRAARSLAKVLGAPGTDRRSLAAMAARLPSVAFRPAET